MAHTESQIMQVPAGEETRQPVSEDNPLSVIIENAVLPPLQSPATVTTEWVVVPGIVAGAAYATGDQMGGLFRIGTQCTGGVVVGVLVVDLDKEQLAFDVLLFSDRVTLAADNAAATLADNQQLLFRGHVSVVASDFAALSDNAVATVRNVGLGFSAPRGYLWASCVTRGVPNYTTARDLAVALVILPDARA